MELSEVNISSKVKELFEFEYDSIYLFGSYARGDHTSVSDIDILIVAKEYQKSIKSEKIAISVYTLDQLLRFAKQGSLFILHLLHESRLLYGEDIIPNLKKNFSYVDYTTFRDQLRESTKVLDVNQEIFEKYEDKLKSVQKFILRSYIYSLSVDQGFLKFSINEVLDQLHLTELEFAFSRTWLANARYDNFILINKKIEALFNVKVVNPYKTIEALLVNNFPEKNLTHFLGMSVLESKSLGLDYPNFIINV